MKARRCRHRGRAAFTLLELIIAALIIGILSAMLLPAYTSMRARAQRVQCAANLHSLYLAADSFVQRNGSWPQIFRAKADTTGTDFANAWIDTLQPFGPTRQTWICPTLQELLHNPDYLQTTDARIDYIPMNFDDKTMTPHRWSRQPWFVEAGNVHGNGNQMIMTDGSIVATKDLLSQ